MGDVKRLATLAGDIESHCESLGFPPEERPFRAHLTLGRVKSSRNLSALADAIEEASALSTEAFLVDEFVLFQSELSPAGARYQALGRFPLSIG